MKNLAGVQANEQIIAELQEAGIDIVVHERRLYTEPITNITGEYGDIKFTRAWTYWVVSGGVYLEDAEEMYAKNCGIRADGDCGNSPPLDYAQPRPAEIEFRINQALESTKEHAIRQNKKYDGELVRESFTKLYLGSRKINLYHIDTQEGLNTFMRILKESPYRYGPDGRTNKVSSVFSKGDETVVHTKLPTRQQLHDEEEERFALFLEEQKNKEALTK